MEKNNYELKMDDGFDPEGGPKKSFIVVDYTGPDPEIVFNEEAKNREEAAAMVLAEKGIVIDYNAENPDFEIIFADKDVNASSDDADTLLAA